MTVGEKIKIKRIEKKLTQKELGEKLGGISQQQIGQWETGKVKPKIETILKISDALSVDLFDLMEVPFEPFPGDADTQSNTIVIDTHIDESHPFNILQKKVKSGVNLTDEERAQYDAYMTEAFHSLSGSLKRFGQTLEEQYQLLNEAGKKKADEQIDHAVEQVKMLTKIPEYQIEQTMGRIANSFKDGHMRFVKKEDSNTQNE